MELFGFDIGALLSNPVGWIPAFIAGAILIAVSGLLLDEASTVVSNIMTYIRHEFINKVPIKAIRDYLLNEQLKSVIKTKEIFIELEKKIKAEL